MAILDPKIECASRETIRQTQLERLQATVNRAYRHVSFYRELFDREGISPEDIRSLDDLRRVPPTSRDDLLAHQPYGMFAVPLRDIVRLHPAAGAGGPIVVGYTRNDIATWTRMAARALTSAGVTESDVVQISLDYAVDAAGIGTQTGAEALGASVIPCSGLAPYRQAEVMRSYRATILAATPSQALHVALNMRDMETASLNLRAVLIVGEVWSVELRAEIQEAFGVEAFGSYGLSEMAVPGLATECAEHHGLHISEDNVYAETIDPETGEPTAEGEAGELLLTTLTREGVPMLRYRTGDLTTLHGAPCPCGRTLSHIEPTHQRIDDLVIVNGMRISPHQIREIIHHIVPDAACSMRKIECEGVEGLEIRVAMGSTWISSKIRDIEMAREHIRLHTSERLGLLPIVRIVESL